MAETLRTPPESVPVIDGRRFDRLPEFDPRSRRHSATRALEEIERERGTALRPRSYTWADSTVLDQGPNGACVGFSWAGELLARPSAVQNIGNADAYRFYREAQKVDEWPGEDYDGTSVIAGAKVVQAAGFIDNYRWVFGNNDELAMVVGYTGPVILGINWYDGMMNPDRNGLVRVSGRVAGGHAILVRGVSMKNRVYRLRNSWGDGWGIGGDCFLSFDDMDRLRHEDGEVCVPIGRHVMPVMR